MSFAPLTMIRFTVISGLFNEGGGTLVIRLTPAQLEPPHGVRPAPHGSSDGTANHTATVHLITIRCVFGGNHCVA